MCSTSSAHITHHARCVLVSSVPMSSWLKPLAADMYEMSISSRSIACCCGVLGHACHMVLDCVRQCIKHLFWMYIVSTGSEHAHASHTVDASPSCTRAHAHTASTHDHDASNDDEVIRYDVWAGAAARVNGASCIPPCTWSHIISLHA